MSFNIVNPFAPKKTFIQRHEGALVAGAAAGVAAALTGAALTVVGHSLAASVAFVDGFVEGLSEADEKKADEKKADEKKADEKKADEKKAA